jgi:hypothetical protein
MAITDLAPLFFLLNSSRFCFSEQLFDNLAVHTRVPGKKLNTMSSLRPKVRSAIQTFLTSQQDEHIKQDILRVIEEEAMLMKETEQLCDAIDIDPMEQLKEIKPSILHRFKQNLKVTSCHRVRAVSGYSLIEAVVTFEQLQYLQLTFRYERKQQHNQQLHSEDDDEEEEEQQQQLDKSLETGSHVRYTIELSKNHQHKENLLVVEVWAPREHPSAEPAVCVNHLMEQQQHQKQQQQHNNITDEDDDDDEDGWEDIEDDGQDETNATKNNHIHQASSKPSHDGQSPNNVQKQASKRQKTDHNDVDNGRNSSNEDVKEEKETQCQDSDDEPTHDSYYVYLDPDLLNEFMNVTGLQPMEEGTGFFLLMTFPFMEHEWDLTGYVLDEVFGCDEDDHDEEDSR